jgi:hypothetical protein
MSFLSTKVLSAYNSSKGSSQTRKEIARKIEEIKHAKTKSAMTTIIHKAK